MGGDAERIAKALERIAAVLEDQSKIGGALWGLGELPHSLYKVSTEISGIAETIGNDPARI